MKRAEERVQDWSGLSLALQTCPRCLGDLVRQHDVYGEYSDCLQCGVEIELAPKVAAGQA
jgi:hypothetical protein